MNRFPLRYGRIVSRRFGALTAVAFLCCSLVAPLSSEAQSVRQDSSLSFVPADTSFYVSSQNHRAMYDAITESRAFDEFVDTPLIQHAIAAFYAGFAQESGMTFEQAWEQAEGVIGEEQLDGMLSFATDVMSHEAFIYGGEGYADLLELYAELGESISPTMLYGNDVDEDAILASLFEQAAAFAENDLDRVVIPDTVIGVRVEDAERARKHIEMLHAFVTLAMFSGEIPRSVRRTYSKQTINDAEFLTIQLDGSMIPWEEMDIPFDQFDDEQAEVIEAYIDHVREMTFAIGIGMYEDFILLSFGDSLEHLEALGEGDLLVDRSEFAAIRQHDDAQFVGIHYCSERMMKGMSFGSMGQMLPGIVDGVAVEIPNEVPNRESLISDLRSDAVKLGAQFDSLFAEPGAVMGFSFMNEHGVDGYTYKWSVSPLSDGSRPLSILDHVGGNPFLFFAGRSTYRPESYSDTRDWIVRMDWYMNEYAKPIMGPDFEEYELFKEQLLPYVKRFDVATGEMLVPSMADGQTAVVIDLKNASQQWTPLMPRSSQPVPIPEFAIVCGLSDKDLFLKAMGEYDDLARDVINELMIALGDEIPEGLSLPDAEHEAIEGGDSYYYPMTEMEVMGLGDAVKPNLSVSDQFAVFSLSLSHSERLLTPTELPSGGPFDRRDQALSGAVGVNTVALIDAVEAWYHYAEEQGAFDELAAELPANSTLTVADILESIDTYLVIARCFQGIECVTYVENGATVTHHRYKFADIPW